MLFSWWNNEVVESGMEIQFVLVDRRIVQIKQYHIVAVAASGQAAAKYIPFFRQIIITGRAVRVSVSG